MFDDVVFALALVIEEREEGRESVLVHLLDLLFLFFVELLHVHHEVERLSLWAVRLVNKG